MMCTTENHPGREAPRLKAVRHVLPPLLGAMAVGLGTTGLATISSHETLSEQGVLVRVEPRLDGHITLDEGLIAVRASTDDIFNGSLKLPAELVGGNIAVQGADATSRVDVSVARAPDTIAKIVTAAEESLRHQYYRAVLFGLVGAAATGGAIEMARRKKGVNPVWPTGAALLASIGVAAAVHPAISQTSLEEAQWSTALSYVPEAQRSIVAKALPETMQKISVRGGNDQARSVIKKFVNDRIVQPLRYYEDKAAEFAATVPDTLPEKHGDETRVLVLADLHGNALMAQYIASMVRNSEADIVAFVGDNGPGLPFDDVLIQPILASVQAAGAQVVYVTGNHDVTAGNKAFQSAGAIELNGKPVLVQGLMLFGAEDNLSTPLGKESYEKWPTAPYAQKLANTACQSQDGETINAAFFHRPAVAADTLAEACAQIVVTGHMHRQEDPALVEEDGYSTYKLWNGTSAGAENVFTFGMPAPSVDADTTLLSFRGGDFYGWQRYTLSSKSGGLVITPFALAKPTFTHQEAEAARSQYMRNRHNIPVGT
jgi:predicted phosphodiesterase/uncharacterized protein YqgV (UPF0045/DUF77 family)